MTNNFSTWNTKVATTHHVSACRLGAHWSRSPSIWRTLDGWTMTKLFSRSNSPPTNCGKEYGKERLGNCCTYTATSSSNV